MKEHKYILEPYKGMKTRYCCPSCNRKKTFTLYINTETNEYIHNTVGRCNRSDNCGYHYTPKQYYTDNKHLFDTNDKVLLKKDLPVIKNKAITPQPKPVSFIPVEIFKNSLKGHETNHFVTFLINQFGIGIASELVSRFFIATSKHWNGATVFWQIDIQGKVRTGKIMLYSPYTGKRVKEPFNHITWVHSLLKEPLFELKQCLFGEHLLIDKTKPVAIVESEKTAIIASVYLPQFIWVAVGSLTNLNTEKCSILKGRTVTLFPDLNGFEKWCNKAKELSHLATFAVSDLLERKATKIEREQGFDLADYLIKFNYKAFTLFETEANEPAPTVQPLAEVNPFEQPEQTYCFDKPEQIGYENWEHDIIELEQLYSGIRLPTKTIQLNPYSTITDCSLFIESHLAAIRKNNGNRTFLPYLNRLKELKQVLILIENSNEKQ